MNTRATLTPDSSNTAEATGRPGVGQRRSRNNLLPLWRIQGTFTLRTPLALGTGEDEPIEEHNKRQGESGVVEAASFIPAIARDGSGNPYLPGSSLKGALRALAGRMGLDDDTIHPLLGSAKPNDLADPDSAENRTEHTKPGALEVRNAYIATALPPTSNLPGYVQTRGTALLPHVVIDRHTGTAEEGLLYLEQVVPPGVGFSVEIVARGVDEAAICTLLGLLQACSEPANGFALGGRGAKGNGRVEWQLGDVQKIENFAHLMKANVSDLWAGACSHVLEPSSLTPVPGASLWLSPLALIFHTPFLVHQAVPKTADTREGDPNGKPRMTHDGRGVLPASSLHGALRSQAERILRTLGAPILRPQDVLPVYSLKEAADKLDEVSILFGATGWCGVLETRDFVTGPNPAKLKHDMVAIDRITGGSKDTAKFCLEVLDCPTLTGGLRLDLTRLRAVSEEAQRLHPKRPSLFLSTLGLLAHVLRDLDEGDIAMGYGAAKGYGVSHSKTVQALGSALDADRINCTGLPTISDALAAWAQTWASAPLHDPASQLARSEAPPNPPHINPIGAACDFHNPYAFLPFPKLRPDDPNLPWAGYSATTKGENHHSHAKNSAQALSGRILCRLSTKTPIFIGAGDDPAQAAGNNPQRKLNFRLNGQVAIPATSLRGMLSSLHESISGSAMRVMDNRGYSVRQENGSDGVNAYSSSAVGRVLLGDDNQISILPLTLPTLTRIDEYELPDSFRECYPKDADGSTWVFGKVLLEPQKMRIPVNGDYQKTRAQRFQDNSAKAYWYVPLEPINLRSGRKPDQDQFRIKVGQGDEVFAIGQTPLDLGDYPLSEDEYLRLLNTNSDLAATYVRGWLRIMHDESRQLPKRTVRKYELFVPYPLELEEIAKPLACTRACLDRFMQLSKERFDSQANKRPAEARLQLPYSPINADRKPGQPLTPQHGDLVYFKPTEEGEAIAEISYSSIWRGRLEANSQAIPSAYMTVSGLPNINLAPLQPGSGRQLLSPSEMLFGFVQDQKDIKKEQTLAQRREQKAKAFKSKMRIGFGISKAPAQLLPPVPLKILASPKPPSASMYFKLTKQENGSYISKGDLTSGAQDYGFKGRKAYLHALRRGDTVQALDANGQPSQGFDALPPWKTRSETADHKPKVKITPIVTQTDNPFFFEIDFNNLSRGELEALCASLVPTPTFEHKLGMGKPIGLGSVKIEPVGLYLIDRARRYGPGNTASIGTRYHVGWQALDLKPEQLPQHLSGLVQDTDFSNTSFDPKHLSQSHMARLARDEPALYRAISLLGNPDAVKGPVHYPQIRGKEIEGENFKWFVLNDKKGRDAPRRQWLQPFKSDSQALPTLERLPEPERPQPARPIQPRR